MEKLVSALIINWNGEKHLGQLIESIQKQTYKNLEIIVWDNVSTDKSVEIAKKFSNVKVFPSKENFGYSGGTNKAIELAEGDYFFILNNDLVLDKKCVEECVKNFEFGKNAGIVFPKQLYYSRFPENYPLSSLPMTTFLGNTVEKPVNGKETNFVLGAAFLISKKCLKDLGYCFDERFFMYFEDTDLSFRAIAHGYKILFEEKAFFWHKTAASVQNARLYFLFRNCLLCYRKNFGIIGLVKFLPWLFFKDFLTITIDLKLENDCLNKMAKGYIDAFLDFGKFKGEKLAKEGKRNVLNSMKEYCGEGCNCNFFKKIYSAIVSIYVKTVFFI